MPVCSSKILERFESATELADYLEALSEAPALDPVLGYSQASSALYAVNNLARALELSGLQPGEITESFARIRDVFASTPLGRHMQNWPSGYCGDYGLVEYLASGNNRATPGTFAFYLERAMLDAAIVQQHQHKLRYQTEAFLRALSEHAFCPQLLSIGCGGCRDLLPILPVLHHFQGKLILNDMDAGALDFAAGRLLPATSRFRTVCANVLTAVRQLRSEGPFHLIVAGGLFDYIPDRLVSAVLEVIFHHLLLPGGAFLFTNIAEGNVFRPLMTYAVDWKLIERSEAEIYGLCHSSRIPNSCISTMRDESHLTWIVRIERPLAA